MPPAALSSSLPNVNQMAGRAASAAQLASAFEMFNDLSAQLADTYREMETRVGELNAELHVVAEQRLRELQEKERLNARLQSLLTLLPAGVMVLDPSGRVAEANPAAIDLLGAPLAGESWRDVIDRAFAPQNDDGHEISLRDGRRISIATRSLDGEPGQLLLLTDLTETRALQQNLARHQRLSEMGRMMSSLAHQIRTPLAAAMLYAGHLCDRQLSTDQIRKFSHKIQDRLQHLEQQVRDMLIFVRGDVKLTDALTSAELLEAVNAALETPLATHSADCTIDNPHADLGVLCNRDVVVGALMNLVNNALQACAPVNGGSGAPGMQRAAPGLHGAAPGLQRVAPGLQRAAPALRIEVRRDGDRIGFAVIDNGPGFDAATAAKLDEPFFTTKPQGTGLGLAVVRAVAEAHHGTFQISSEPGRGTCAALWFPLWPARSAA